MKIVVCWENSKEKPAAGRIADMIRNFITRKFPQIDVMTSYVENGHFGPYRNDAEALAAEAQRLLEAQEAAFGERRGASWEDLMGTMDADVSRMAAQAQVPPIAFGDPMRDRSSWMLPLLRGEPGPAILKLNATS